MLFPVLHVYHAFLVQPVPEEVQLCVGQVVLFTPAGLEALEDGGLVDRGDTVGEPFCKSAKEAVNDAGSPAVDPIFELEDSSGLKRVGTGYRQFKRCEHDICGPFVDLKWCLDSRSVPQWAGCLSCKTKETFVGRRQT